MRTAAVPGPQTHHASRVTLLFLVGLPEYDAGLRVDDHFFVTLARSVHLDLPDQDAVFSLEIRILDPSVRHLAQRDPTSTSLADPHVRLLDLVLAEDLVGRLADFRARLVGRLLELLRRAAVRGQNYPTSRSPARIDAQMTAS